MPTFVHTFQLQLIILLCPEKSSFTFCFFFWITILGRLYSLGSTIPSLYNWHTHMNRKIAYLNLLQGRKKKRGADHYNAFSLVAQGKRLETAWQQTKQPNNSKAALRGVKLRYTYNFAEQRTVPIAATLSVLPALFLTYFVSYQFCFLRMFDCVEFTTNILQEKKNQVLSLNACCWWAHNRKKLRHRLSQHFCIRCHWPIVCPREASRREVNSNLPTSEIFTILQYFKATHAGETKREWSKSLRGSVKKKST